MSSGAVSKIPIIGFNIKKLAKTPVGLRMVILRKLQERMGELAMSRFVVHGTDNLNLQKSTLDGFELTINALTLFVMLPPLLSVFGNHIRHDKMLDSWFNKYPIYREWKDLQDGKIQITTVNTIDAPIVVDILKWLGIEKPVNSVFNIAKNIGVLVTEIANQINEAIDALQAEPNVIVDYLNFRHNKIRFPLELTQIDKNLWIIAIPTLFLEFAVLTSGIYLWWAYNRAFEKDQAEAIKRKKALLFPRIKDVDLGALPIKLDVAGKTVKVEQFLTYGERRFSFPATSLQDGAVANMFGLKTDLLQNATIGELLCKYSHNDPPQFDAEGIDFRFVFNPQNALLRSTGSISNLDSLRHLVITLRVYFIRQGENVWHLIHESDFKLIPNETKNNFFTDVPIASLGFQNGASQWLVSAGNGICSQKPAFQVSGINVIEISGFGYQFYRKPSKTIFLQETESHLINAPPLPEPS